MAYKSKKIGFNPKVILSGRKVNDSMSIYLVNKFIKKLKQQNNHILNKEDIGNSITFKENVKDVRNSKAIEVIKYLVKKGLKVDAYDEYVDYQILKKSNSKLVNKIKPNFYDGIILLVPHNYLKQKKKINI